jgi:uncharacterized protein
MSLPLMPKATAVWLVENTSLSFDQIADFCGLHSLEIQAIADGEAAFNMVGFDPVASSQLSVEEIKRCEADPSARLSMRPVITADSVLGKKKGRYTPVSKRQDRPDGIAWLLKYHPSLSDTKICALLGTTRETIKAVKNKTHWNSANIKPRSPVLLGLCSQPELDTLLRDKDA